MFCLLMIKEMQIKTRVKTSLSLLIWQKSNGLLTHWPERGLENQPLSYIADRKVNWHNLYEGNWAIFITHVTNYTCAHLLT